MKNCKTLIFLAMLFSVSFMFAACGRYEGVPYFNTIGHGDVSKTEALKNLPAGKLSIVQVDALMHQGLNDDNKGPDLTSVVGDMDTNDVFNRTPTGSYIMRLVSAPNNLGKIEEASSKVLNLLGTNSLCRSRCSPAFKESFSKNRNLLESRLVEVTKSAVANEILNVKDFLPLYHGFPNEFRLYHDVIRTLKSFEQLEMITKTFPLRDFAFTDSRVELDNFLMEWWNEYQKHVQEQNAAPFPVEGQPSPGKAVGLTFYPDAISYARNYILSTNVNLFGNTLSPASNTVFFFLNSTSAAQLDIVGPLIKNALSPYLKSSDGQFDQHKYERIYGELKEIFQYYLASSGGQMAQILVKKDIAPKVSYLSWSGGEPVWISQSTKHVVYAKDEKGGFKVMPPIVFWPTTQEQTQNYRMPNIVQMMDDFVYLPQTFLSYFPLVSRKKFSDASAVLGENTTPNLINEFVARDIQQARLLPNPKYFTDQKVTGVKIYTQNEVSPDRIAAYNEAIFQVVRGIIADFLASAQSANDFKEGDYSLKNAFIERQKSN